MTTKRPPRITKTPEELEADAMASTKWGRRSTNGQHVDDANVALVKADDEDLGQGWKRPAHWNVTADSASSVPTQDDLEHYDPHDGDNRLRSQLRIERGEQLANGRRRWTLYRAADQVHVDTFDIGSDFHRQNFLEKSCVCLGISKLPPILLPNDEPERVSIKTIERLLWEASLKAEQADDEPIAYKLISCRELASTLYAVTFLVNWLLVAGQPCIVAGGKKTLKTSIIVALGLALATAGKFLGVFQVPRAVRVLLMSGESGLAKIKATAQSICLSMGLELADIDNLIFSEDLPKLGDPQHTESMRWLLKENSIEILLIDPVYLSLQTGGEESSLFSMGPKLRIVSEVCRELGTTPILVHHNRKNIANPYEPPELEDIAWAGFAEFARQWVLIGRREKYVPGTGFHRLWLNVGGSIGHGGLWAMDVNEGPFDPNVLPTWHVQVLKADEARKQVEERKDQAKETKSAETLDKHKRKITAVLAKAAYVEGETASRIRPAAGLQPKYFEAALAALIQDGDVVTCTVQRGNNRVYDGFRLANT